MTDVAELKIEGFDELLADLSDLERGKGPLTDRVVDTMEAGLSALLQAIVSRTPVGVSGNLRGSIASMWTGTPPMIEGEVATGILYGEPAEYGRKPGKAPVDMIGRGPRGGKIWAAKPGLELWVRRVLGLQGAEARDAALAIAWHIAKHGTEGAHMFQDGFTDARPTIEALWERLLDDLVTEMAAT